MNIEVGRSINVKPLLKIMLIYDFRISSEHFWNEVRQSLDVF